MKLTIRIKAKPAKRNPVAKSLGARAAAAKVFINRKRTPRRGRWPDHADWAEI